MTKRRKYLQWQKVENIWNDKSLKTLAMIKSWKYLQWHKFEKICNDKKLKIFAMTKSWKYLVVRPSRFCSVTRLTGSTCVEFLDYNPITSSLKYTSCKISQSNYFLLVWELKDWVVISITLRRKFYFLFLFFFNQRRSVNECIKFFLLSFSQASVFCILYFYKYIVYFPFPSSPPELWSRQ